MFFYHNTPPHIFPPDFLFVVHKPNQEQKSLDDCYLLMSRPISVTSIWAVNAPIQSIAHKSTPHKL